jgi:hypothetical protein
VKSAVLWFSRAPRWQFKVAIQFLLAHVPGGEKLNNLLQRWNGTFSDSVIRARVIEVGEILVQRKLPEISGMGLGFFRQY